MHMSGLTSHSDRFNPGKEARNPFKGGCVGPQGPSGGLEEQINLLPLVGSEPRTVQPSYP